jgi:hypothetical protein
VVLASFVLAPAAERCPYLNAGTAAGILGGPVQSKIEKSACHFALEPPAAPAELEIRVETIVSPVKFLGLRSQCIGPVSVLTGLGNEAFACSAGAGEQVIGRVRNQVFVIRLTAASDTDRSQIRQRARAAADVVAGNLF